MRKTTTYLCATLVALFITATVSAQGWRGTGRIQGTIIDKNTGKPVAGAKLKLGSAKADNTGPEILADARGKWVAGGLIGGSWNLDVSAPGYIDRKIVVEVAELRSIPAMKIELEPVPPPEPVKEQPQETESIQVGGVTITAETAAALEAANGFMKEKKWKEAAAEYEKAIVALPENTSLKFAMSRAYYGAGELKKAIAPLQAVYDADNGNMTAAQLLANMLIEDGQVDAGKAVLASMPPGSMTDPTAIINIGILFLNQGKVEDAHAYFGKAVSLAPELPETYYYRALASLQLKKMDAAKADFKKVIELGPDSPEAKDARELLAQLK